MCKLIIDPSKEEALKTSNDGDLDSYDKFHSLFEIVYIFIWRYLLQVYHLKADFNEDV